MQAETLPLDDQYREFVGRDSGVGGVTPDYRMRTAKIGVRPARRRPWLVTRLFRGTVRFCIAVLIGIGGTLGWQSYGDQISDWIKTYDPSLNWVVALLPPSPAPQSPDGTAAASTDLGQQLKLIALDVAIVRRNMEQIANNQGQLAAKTEQMTQNIAALQEAEQDVRQKIAGGSPAAAPHALPRKPPQAMAPMAPSTLQTTAPSAAAQPSR